MLSIVRMASTDPDTLLRQLKWRYATKQFDPAQKIPAKVWAALEETLVLAPSSFGVQPWKFLVIDDPSVRAELRTHSWGQSQIVDASHLVVFLVQHPVNPAAVRRFIERTAEVRGVSVETLAGYEKVVNGFVGNFPSEIELRAWAARQVYIAFGGFMTAAALLGVDTCPIEGLDPAGYDQVLGLAGTGYFTLAACPAGYRLATDKYAATPKVRFKHEHVIQHI